MSRCLLILCAASIMIVAGFTSCWAFSISEGKTKIISDPNDIYKVAFDSFDYRLFGIKPKPLDKLQHYDDSILVFPANLDLQQTKDGTLFSSGNIVFIALNKGSMQSDVSYAVVKEVLEPSTSPWPVVRSTKLFTSDNKEINFKESWPYLIDFKAKYINGKRQTTLNNTQIFHKDNKTIYARLIVIDGPEPYAKCDLSNPDLVLYFYKPNEYQYCGTIHISHEEK